VSIAVSHQMMVESALYSRLGLYHLHWMSGEVYQECYASESTSQDVLNSVCRRALSLVRRGRYTEAIEALENVEPEMLRIVKRSQMWMSAMNSIKLQRALRRDDRTATAHYLAQARAYSWHYGKIDVATRIWELEFEMRKGELTSAYAMVDDLLRSVNTAESDVHDKLQLMVLKARVLDKAGVPQKGFSLAIRAASMAYSTRNLAVLYQAVGALCRILISLREFEPASQVLTSIMPQVLECEDCDLAARSFSILADAHVGMAGLATAGSRRRKENMSRALEFLGRAFDEYSRLEDVPEQCEMLAKRAMIMRVNGDLVLANDTAAKALDIRHEAAKAVEA
jgi:anaphase-promoting complex subunit 5